MQTEFNHAANDFAAQRQQQEGHRRSSAAVILFVAVALAIWLKATR